MKRRWIGLTLVTMGLIGAGSLAVWAAEKEEKEDKITIEQVPEKARAELTKRAKKNTIKEVEKESEHGAVGYEAAWDDPKGHEHSAVVTEEGALMGTERDLGVEEVPELVKKAIEKMMPGAEKLKYERSTTVVYEISGIVDGKKSKLHLTAAGTKTKGEHEEGEKSKEK